LVNAKVSCLACKSGFTRKTDGGPHLECSENLAWWAWLLIALAIAVVVAGIIVAIIFMTKKKPVQNDPYNQFEMAKNPNYMQN
jgi:anti-sigma-K factor RskA